MIERKKKKCKGCEQETYIYARSLCLSCDRRENPNKHGLKVQENSSGKGNTKLPKKKRIAPVSAKQAARLREYRKLRDEYMSLHTKCEVRGCNRPSEDLHHVRPRAYHLLDTSVFLAVCRICHERIEREDAWARENRYKLNHLTSDESND